MNLTTVSRGLLVALLAAPLLAACKGKDTSTPAPQTSSPPAVSPAPTTPPPETTTPPATTPPSTPPSTSTPSSGGDTGSTAPR